MRPFFGGFFHRDGVAGVHHRTGNRLAAVLWKCMVFIYLNLCIDSGYGIRQQFCGNATHGIFIGIFEFVYR